MKESQQPSHLCKILGSLQTWDKTPGYEFYKKLGSTFKSRNQKVPLGYLNHKGEPAWVV